MTILRERVVVIRGVNRKKRQVMTPGEQDAIRVAMRALVKRYGGANKLARRLGMSRTTVAHVLYGRSVSPELAFRVAGLARMPVSDVVSGAWPIRCPVCGRP